MKYYKWIQFLTKEREKIRDLKIVDQIEKILCAITFATPYDKLIEGKFSASFQEMALNASDEKYSYKEETSSGSGPT